MNLFRILACISLGIIALSNQGICLAQTSKVTIYDPGADASSDVKAAITKAQLENRHVLVQIGGNWCPWCLKLHNFFQNNQQVDSLLKADYVIIRINYSKENKNLSTLKELDFPQRFGFPVLVILDGNGKRLHTQDTGLLESGDGYDIKKVIGFLKGWSPAAIDPKKY